MEPTYGNVYRERTWVWALPTGDAAIAAMASWHMNAVRIPLNVDCWLGINPVWRYPDSVSRIRGRAAGAAGRALPDRDHSPAFWASVAQTFTHDSVVLELFNEPIRQPESSHVAVPA